MNKNQKRKLYESIMLSTSKVIKKKLNEMATRSNKDVLTALKRMIIDYAESNDVSSVEIKKALGSLSRTWDMSSITTANQYDSIQEFLKTILIKRLNGEITGSLNKKDKMYIYKSIKKHLSLSNFGGDPDDDYLIGIMGERNTNKIIKFLKYILAGIIPYFENQSDIFGISNEETQELLEYYENERFDDDKISGIFCYIMYGGFGDHFEAEDLIDNAMNDIYG